MDWQALFYETFNLFERMIIFYVALINVIYLLLMVLGYFVIRRYGAKLSPGDRDALLRSGLLPEIAVIVPAYNEEATIRNSVRALLNVAYPKHEVIVVNDGSKDDTLQILIDEFRLYRSSRVIADEIETQPVKAVYESRDPIVLVVVDKENGGKADALNAGVCAARAPLIAAIDADSLLESGALLYAVKPFLENYEETIATGGIIRVVNGCRVEHGRVQDVRVPTRWLPLFQTVEYLRAFLGGRVAFSFLNSLLLISGAFGLFKREALVDAGGFSDWTVGEDMELVVKLHEVYRKRRQPYRIVFVADPVCWTEVPESMRVLQSQRNRWQRGTVESLGAHRGMMLNPAYGAVGLFAMPYFFLFEMIGPAIELLGYVMTVLGLTFGLIAPHIAVLFFLISVVFGILLSLGAVLLEELTVRRYTRVSDVAKLTVAAIVENLGYRQLLTLWRVKGLIDAFRGKKGWGVMERRGFG